MSSPVESFAHRLRHATQTQHQALESLAFNHALLNETLPRTAYIQHLQSYYVVQDALEQHCQHNQHPALAKVWACYQTRTEQLQQDLRYFNVLGELKHPPTEAFVASLDAWQQHKPSALIGALYVHQGSMLGARILLPHIQRALQLKEGEGCCYYTETQPLPWRSFKQSLDQVAIRYHCADDIIEGAQQSFTHVHQILEDLLPDSPST